MAPSAPVKFPSCKAKLSEMILAEEENSERKNALKPFSIETCLSPVARWQRYVDFNVESMLSKCILGTGCKQGQRYNSFHFSGKPGQCWASVFQVIRVKARLPKQFVLNL